MENSIQLEFSDILIASLLILINGGLSFALKLKLERAIFIAAIRMVVQLFLVGWILIALFQNSSLLFTGCIALVMIAFAGYEIMIRQERRLSGLWSYGLGFSCMFFAAILVTIFGLLTQLRPEPWYNPQYSIPILGIILGNTLTGISLGLDTLTFEATRYKSNIEAQLLLGKTYFKAMRPIIKRALRNALMPTINMMAAAGIVSLPGMMTGQIISGIPPIEAVKYQILVMFLIAGGTAIGSIMAVYGASYRLTDNRHRLRVDRLSKKNNI